MLILFACIATFATTDTNECCCVYMYMFLSLRAHIRERERERETSVAGNVNRTWEYARKLVFCVPYCICLYAHSIFMVYVLVCMTFPCQLVEIFQMLLDIK